MVWADNVSVGRDKGWEATLLNGFDKSGPKSGPKSVDNEAVLDWALTALCSNPTAGTSVKSRLGVLTLSVY
jgi:hypothetical protein